MTDRVYKLLMRPRRIQSVIIGLKSEREGLQLSMLPEAIRYDRDRVMTSPNDSMTEYAVKLDDIDRRLADLQESYLRAHECVVAITDKLIDQDDGLEQATAIKLRFLSGMSFSDIARTMHVSDSTMFRRYRKGLSRLDDIVTNFDSE